MQLGSQSMHVVVTAEPETYADGEQETEVWVTIGVRVETFTASLASCVVRTDWNTFLDALRTLDDKRRGEAALRSADPRELEFRVYASDNAGHMAIDGQLQRLDLPGSPVFRFAGISFDPDGLPALLKELTHATAAAAQESTLSTSGGATRFTSEDIHRALFPDGAPISRSISELKKGIRQSVRTRHGRKGV